MVFFQTDVGPVYNLLSNPLFLVRPFPYVDAIVPLRRLVQDESPETLGILVIVMDKGDQPRPIAYPLQQFTGDRSHWEKSSPFGPDLERFFLHHVKSSQVKVKHRHRFIRLIGPS